MIKYTWFNTYYSKTGTRLGMCGCAGERAETYQQAVDRTIEDANSTRKLWGFPIKVKTKIEFEQEP